MANLSNFFHISAENFATLSQTGTVTINGVTYTFDPEHVEYVLPDDSIQGVKVDGTELTPDSDGKVNITGKENSSNKVTTISSSSTDTQYPSAKCVYDNLNTKLDSSLELTASDVSTIWTEVYSQ